MKVTLLVAVCTLAVLLGQMETPMAMPQLDRPVLLEDFRESLFGFSWHETDIDSKHVTELFLVDTYTDITIYELYDFLYRYIYN